MTYSISDSADTISYRTSCDSFFADGGGRPKFISCPADWACSVINRNLIKAEGLEGVFDVVDQVCRLARGRGLSVGHAGNRGGLAGLRGER